MSGGAEWKGAPTLADRVRGYSRGCDEEGRLDRTVYHRLEFQTTLRYLRRLLPPRGHLLDAGGGPGRYTVALARRRYRVSMVVLLPEHVEAASRAVRRARVGPRVPDLLPGSFEDLSRFSDGTFDGVQSLGAALGHLVDRRRRDRALTALVRVAKRGAPVFVLVIGRLSMLSSSMIANPKEWESDPKLYQRIERTGDYDGHSGFAPCHFFLVEELEGDLRRAGVTIVRTVGLEGPLPPYPQQGTSLPRGTLTPSDPGGSST